MARKYTRKEVPIIIGQNSEVFKNHPHPDFNDSLDSPSLSHVESVLSDVESDRRFSTCSSSFDSYEKQATVSMSNLYEKINCKLYGETDATDLPSEINEECDDWIKKFPYLRLKGSKLTNVPDEEVFEKRNVEWNKQFSSLLLGSDYDSTCTEDSSNSDHDDLQPAELCNDILDGLLARMCTLVANQLEERLKPNSKEQSCGQHAKDPKSTTTPNLSGILQVQSKILQHRKPEYAIKSSTGVSINGSTIHMPCNKACLSEEESANHTVAFIEHNMKQTQVSSAVLFPPIDSSVSNGLRSSCSGLTTARSKLKDRRSGMELNRPANNKQRPISDTQMLASSQFKSLPKLN